MRACVPCLDFRFFAALRMTGMSGLLGTSVASTSDIINSMSEIDSYKHECIGILNCPRVDLFPDSERDRQRKGNQFVPLYLLHEDALDADTFYARKGDLLLGGGSGEAEALWIGMPDALLFFTGDVDDELWPSDMYETIGDMHESVYHAFWSPTA